MDKRFIIGVCTGFGLTAISLISFLPEIAEAIYSIPPTNAWQSITIDNNVIWPNSSDNFVNATSYRDSLFLVSDGSILINITSYP